MIDQAAGIEAFVATFGSDEQYDEHLAPRNSPLYNGKPNERFIQAITNERFQVRVRIPEGFKFGSSDWATVRCHIDGSTSNARRFVPKKCKRSHEI